jgi:hypothetical protein
MRIQKRKNKFFICSKSFIKKNENAHLLILIIKKEDDGQAIVHLLN